MLSVICAGICIVLVILDMCHKFPFAKIGGQISIWICSFLGAASPLAANACSRSIAWLLTDTNSTMLLDAGSWFGRLNDVFSWKCPVWLSVIGVVVCFGAWCYAMMRTASNVPVISPGESSAAAARRQLAVAWTTLPFFLMALITSFLIAVYALGIMIILVIVLLTMALIFLPAILMGAVICGWMSLVLLAELLPYLGILILPYFTGVFYINRYLIACGVCCGWKRGFRIFLQVLCVLPWVRWIVVCFCMARMQKNQF